MARARRPSIAPGARLPRAMRERMRSEGLGEVWLALTGMNPARLMPQLVATVLQHGLTRPSWQWRRAGREHVLMVWPKDQPVRAGVLMAGEEGGELRPASAVPILEGLPNDLIVEEVHPRAEGLGADVGASVREGVAPLWFYDPLYGRDREDLTPGVTQSFNLAALALALRRGLLDELTVTGGPRYEAHAEAWLAENPGRARHEVPPLKVPLAGRHVIMPGPYYCQYQVRAAIQDMEDAVLEKMPVRILYLSFPMEEGAPLRLPVYASRAVLGDYEPQKGDEIDAILWVQGRIIDFDGEPAAGVEIS